MAKALQCDGCGKFFNADQTKSFQNEDGHIINSVRIGNWNSNKFAWESIGSAYDLCASCGEALYNAVYDALPKMMKIKHRDTTPSKKAKANVANDVQKKEEEKEEE